jgi:hypothetical protein
LDKATWASEWRTTKKTVHNFFKLLEKDKMVVTENIRITTRLTVCKYDSYNQNRNGKETHPTTHSTTDSKRNLPTNKNDKEGKEEIITNVIIFSETEKKEFFDFQEWIGKNTPALLDMKEPFLIEHFTELRKKYTKRQITDMCEKMHNNNGLTKKYKSAHVTLKNWIKQYGT